MTNKTDAAMLTELKAKFKPAARGVLSASEIDLVETTLQIKDRTDVELQNVRDMAVMFWGRLADPANNPPAVAMDRMDEISGICGVIDMEKSRRGMPV